MLGNWRERISHESLKPLAFSSSIQPLYAFRPLRASFLPIHPQEKDSNFNPQAFQDLIPVPKATVPPTSAKEVEISLSVLHREFAPIVGSDLRVRLRISSPVAWIGNLTFLRLKNPSKIRKCSPVAFFFFQREILSFCPSMVEVVILDDSSVDGLAKSDAKDHRKSVKKSNKRKRSMVDESLSAQERESLVAGFQWELDGLYAYFKDVMREKVLLDLSSCHSSNSLVSFLLEESPLPFSKLVDGIYEKMRSHEGTTLASVRSCVLSVGQRSAYGVAKADANVLEDDCESCLWCWEVIL
ncbi:hypothetical protein ACLOJK_011736 [Asimina triloba]